MVSVEVVVIVNLCIIMVDIEVVIVNLHIIVYSREC
jgi:hypothetical protein